ncbi:hypothetical protein ABIE85_007124 [Bradyrhizobium diazoefficiens]
MILGLPLPYQQLYWAGPQTATAERGHRAMPQRPPHADYAEPKAEAKMERRSLIRLSPRHRPDRSTDGVSLSVLFAVVLRRRGADFSRLPRDGVDTTFRQLRRPDLANRSTSEEMRFSAVSRSGSRHCQRTTTRQPSLASAARAFRSRSRFFPIFSVQNSTFDFGNFERRQRWPCQKQPWTNTAIPSLGSTKSGLPGRSERCRRKRSPTRCAALRASTSGAVFLLLTAAIFRDRCSRVSLSAI